MNGNYLSIAVITGLMRVAAIPAAATSPTKTAGNLMLFQSPSKPLACSCSVILSILSSNVFARVPTTRE
jgi:hypothetical protein